MAYLADREDHAGEWSWGFDASAAEAKAALCQRRHPDGCGPDWWRGAPDDPGLGPGLQPEGAGRADQRQGPGPALEAERGPAPGSGPHGRGRAGSSHPRRGPLALEGPRLV